MDEEILKVSGLVAAVFRSPTWVSPIATFVDEHCGVFEDQEENKLEYTLIHQAFKKLVDELLEVHLQELNITQEAFTRFCHHGMTGDNDFHRELVEQLLSVDDFLVFKAMMVKRNLQLYHQALQLFGFTIMDPTGPPYSGSDDVQVAPPEDPLSEEQRLEMEAMRLEAERAELQRKCVEAELQLAMALSLQLQRRLQLMETLSNLLEMLSQNAGSEEAQQVADSIEAMFVQPLFAVSPGVQEDDAAAEQFEALQAAQQRERAQQAMQVSRQQAAERAAVSAPSEDEKRARAEHLKRQRDALLEKKKRDREQELQAHSQAHGETGAARVAEQAMGRSGDVGKRLVAELGGQAAAPPPPQDNAAAEMRKMLTSQLKHRITGSG